jgi:serine/threonine-protein kinase
MSGTGTGGTSGAGADQSTIVVSRDDAAPPFDLSTSGYFIVGEPKAGGMASVYRAHQPTLGRDVAIKVLSPFLAADPNFVQRFYEEARRTARLEHPNIVPIYDLGQASNGSLFLVMRYIDGMTLQELLEIERRLAVPRAIRLIRQVGEALAYAHNRGIIHRDIKPSNIMIEAGDRATLMDFGIAKLSEGGGITRPGLVVGTPKYLSPEQAAAEQVDSRSDLYSLGVVLYETVAGRPPFDSDSPRNLLQAHLLVTPPAPTQFNPAIPAALEEIILKALEKDRAARYQSAEAFVADLARVENGK